jgi:hypothetical protein
VRVFVQSSFFFALFSFAISIISTLFGIKHVYCRKPERRYHEIMYGKHLSGILPVCVSVDLVF